MVKKLITKELEIYSADRLGKFDFALHSAGKIMYVCYQVIGDKDSFPKSLFPLEHFKFKILVFTKYLSCCYTLAIVIGFRLYYILLYQ